VLTPAPVEMRAGPFIDYRSLNRSGATPAHERIPFGGRRPRGTPAN
jgi:hypothetical protein